VKAARSERLLPGLSIITAIARKEVAPLLRPL
jgi:hypothetical protein